MLCLKFKLRCKRRLLSTTSTQICFIFKLMRVNIILYILITRIILSLFDSISTFKFRPVVIGWVLKKYIVSLITSNEAFFLSFRLMNRINLATYTTSTQRFNSFKIVGVPNVGRCFEIRFL